MEIIPKQAIGPFKFGMTPEEVRASVEEPETYEDWMGGNLNDSILYRGLILGFDKYYASGPLPGSKLIEFNVRDRSDASIFGRQFSEWSWLDLKKYLDSAQIEFNINRTSSSEMDVDVPALNLQISFENENLFSVEGWA